MADPTNLFSLSGRHVVVAGAAGALGSASARACAAMGARLTLLDFAEPKAVAEKLSSSAEVRCFGVDNRSVDGIEAVFRAIGAVDGLADCSGVYEAGDWTDGQGWEALLSRTIATNVAGPMNLVRGVLPGMAERGAGQIVLTSSAAGRNAGASVAAEPAYVASKGAIVALTRRLARQFVGQGVTVNAVAPGPIFTPLLQATQTALQGETLPMHRFGEPEEVGWPVAFLCSPASGYMTGTILDINGGMYFS